MTGRVHALVVVVTLLCTISPVRAGQEEWASRRRQPAPSPGADIPPVADRCRRPHTLADTVLTLCDLPDSLRAETWRKRYTLERSIDYRADSWDFVVTIGPNGLVKVVETHHTTILDTVLLASLTRVAGQWTFYARDIPPDGVTVFIPATFTNRRRRRIIGNVAWIVSTALVGVLLELITLR